MKFLTPVLLIVCVALLSAKEEPPDVWIVSGQSNACGRAELPGYEEHKHVRMFDGDKWVTAKEPLPLGGTVGPWLAAATETAKAGLCVDICGWACGGKPIKIWEENGIGWKSLSEQILKAGKNAGVFLWYQGESDSQSAMTQVEYEKNLTNLINRVRKEANNPLMQVVIIQLSKYGTGKATTMEIREAQRQVVLKDQHALLVAAIGRNCDGVHLKKDGYFELGREISRALLKFKYGKKDINWPGPILDVATHGKEEKSIVAHFAEVSKLAGVNAADFGVVDSDGQIKITSAQQDNTRVVLNLEREVKLPAKVIYGFGLSPIATLIDEAGNRAPAVVLSLSQGPVPTDRPTECPNGAGILSKPSNGK